jgi:hypothetical protein
VKLTKKEMASLVATALLLPGGSLVAGAWLLKKLRIDRRSSKDVSLSTLDKEAAISAKFEPLSRQKHNKEILALLTKLVKENPEMRFGQLMRNYMVVREERPVNPSTTDLPWRNEFYLESETLLERIRRAVEGRQEP